MDQYYSIVRRLFLMSGTLAKILSIQSKSTSWSWLKFLGIGSLQSMIEQTTNKGAYIMGFETIVYFAVSAFSIAALIRAASN
jgi:hypothetical protein